MSLRHSYTLMAPVYDSAVAFATERARRESLRALADKPSSDVLLPGIGTGLDLPFLPPSHRYVGIELTPAMLRRARQRAARQGITIELREGDAMALESPAQSFDAVVMHLILAVVPHPERALAEAARVLRPGGEIIIFDKFLKPGERAIGRRLLNMVTRHLATRTDVVFEDLLACCPGLRLIEDRPALAGGWFRHIRLKKPLNSKD